MASSNLGWSGCILAQASTAARASLERFMLGDRLPDLPWPLFPTGELYVASHPENFFPVTVISLSKDPS